MKLKFFFTCYQIDRFAEIIRSKYDIFQDWEIEDDEIRVMDDNFTASINFVDPDHAQITVNGVKSVLIPHPFYRTETYNTEAIAQIEDLFVRIVNIYNALH